MYRPIVEVGRKTPGWLATKGAIMATRIQQRVRAGIAGVVALGLFTFAATPTAGAQNELAGWLSKAIVPVSDIHKAESDALAADLADPVDTVKLQAACTRLNDANHMLGAQMPPPDTKLNVEVQQAIDNFETAAQACTDVIAFRPDPKKSEEDNDEALGELSGNFRVALIDAEQHLAAADAIVLSLAR